MARDPTHTTSIQPSSPRQMVFDALQPALDRASIEISDVDDELNVIDRGIVDSIEFLDTVAAIERSAGVEVDLFDIDPDVLTTVGGLIRIFEEAVESTQ